MYRCPLGEYSGGIGAAFCRLCPSGYYGVQSAAGAICLACPAGTHQDEFGQTYCKNCSISTYSDAEGLSDCKP